METHATTFRGHLDRSERPSADSARYYGSDDGKEPFYLDLEVGAAPRESLRPSTPHPDPPLGRGDTEGAAARLGSTLASSSLTVGSSRPPTPPGSPLTPIEESSRPHTPPSSPVFSTMNSTARRPSPPLTSLSNLTLSLQQTPESPGSTYMPLSPISPCTVVSINSNSPLQQREPTGARSYAMSGPEDNEPPFLELTASENSSYAPSSTPVRPGLRQRTGSMTEKMKKLIKSTVNSAI